MPNYFSINRSHLNGKIVLNIGNMMLLILRLIPDPSDFLIIDICVPCDINWLYTSKNYVTYTIYI